MSTDMFPDAFIKYTLDYNKGFAAATVGAGDVEPIESQGWLKGFSDGVDAQLKDDA